MLRRVPALRRLSAVVAFVVSLLPLFAAAADVRLVVHKAARKLEVVADGAVTKTYRIGLGFAPLGAKTRTGDGRTPEGIYRVCVKNAQSRFYRSLGLSYPGPADAAAALAEKRLTRAQHDAILAADAKRTVPPWNTPLGGEIFIHGRGASSDWTLGCVALEDADMLELFTAIPTGTVVEIRP